MASPSQSTDAPGSDSGQPRCVSSRDALRRAVAEARALGKTIGLVPTMGALHEGHLSLVDACREECGFTVVTIFVNPTQFAPGEDYEQYPRTMETDQQALGRRKADLVFAPAADEMYRPGHETYVEVGGVSESLEGESRPGHFRGVATIVLKLFNSVGADIAYFGQKDYQQSLVIRRLVEDLDLPIQIRVCPIVRDPDGLAMSSRNVNLSDQERRRALAISECLAQADDLASLGERNAEKIRRQMTQHLERQGLDVEYVELVKDGTMTRVNTVEGPTVALVAAKVGKTRLIDNRIIG